MPDAVPPGTPPGRSERGAATPARERVLAVAETLFAERGYAAVTMRDIAEALDMKQASLYYHAPQGKEQLFVAVVERSMTRHRQGLERALHLAGDDATAAALRARLRRAAEWLLSQPPVSLVRMLRSDMPALSEAHAEKLSALAFRSLLAPLATAFERAMASGAIRASYPELLAGSFLSAVDGAGSAVERGFARVPVARLIDELIEVYLRGLEPRPMAGGTQSG